MAALPGEDQDEADAEGAECAAANRSTISHGQESLHGQRVQLQPLAELVQRVWALRGHQQLGRVQPLAASDGNDAGAGGGDGGQRTALSQAAQRKCTRQEYRVLGIEINLDPEVRMYTAWHAAQPIPTARLLHGWILAMPLCTLCFIIPDIQP
jgi:hypothetical protein